ncbi:MAG: NAD-dependent epimerase/dehydratase family protein [Gammaproteobacteria bacterium TMED112]|nr:MAG: NAD-dependent epimerase/dehydratase family protein [Gammaproteobacteria bacterium TMED112]
MKKFLVTGAAGFIGHHFIKKLLDNGNYVIGIDNYGLSETKKLSKIRLSTIKSKNFSLLNLDINEKNFEKNLKTYEFDCVVHLAAKAGIRTSFRDPLVYINNNIISHQNILDLCKARKVPLYFASSSSVYGNHANNSSNEADLSDHPTSIYGVTKKTTEMLSQVYSDKYNLKVYGFRFFTVYGILGRPDMAYWIFAKKILQNKPIKVFGNPNLIIRDFTHVSDITSGLLSAIESNRSNELFKIYNLGRGKPETLADLINYISEAYGKKPSIDFKSSFYGDVRKTSACIISAKSDFGYNPKINLQEGIYEFCNWFKNFNK